jgi:hypothetical protein
LASSDNEVLPTPTTLLTNVISWLWPFVGAL